MTLTGMADDDAGEPTAGPAAAHLHGLEQVIVPGKGADLEAPPVGVELGDLGVDLVEIVTALEHEGGEAVVGEGVEEGRGEDLVDELLEGDDGAARDEGDAARLVGEVHDGRDVGVLTALAAAAVPGGEEEVDAEDDEEKVQVGATEKLEDMSVYWK